MNWGMLGHEWAVSLLKDHVVRNYVSHAYLFCGPQGIGRRTLALRFAQALNCPQPIAPGEPCQECRICRQFETMQHPDLFIVQAEQQGGILKVEQVRELQHNLSLHPYETRYRVAVLLRFEEANLSAMNALLKTLEEPAPSVVLILTANSAESLLPTIVSRCEVLRLRALSMEQIRQGLQNLWGIPAPQAQLLSSLSEGRPGYAKKLHQNPELLLQRQSWLDDHDQLLSANRVERFAYAEALSKNRSFLRLTLLTWLSLWRDVMLKAANASTPLTNVDRMEQVQKLAEVVGLDKTCRVIATLERTLEMLDLNVNTRLALEVLMLNLPIQVKG